MLSRSRSFAAAALLVALSLSSCSARTDVGSLSGDKSLSLKLTGSEVNDVLSLVVQNSGKTDRKLSVRAGTAFASLSDPDKIMVSASDQHFTAPAGKTMTFPLPVFSLKQLKTACDAGESFQLKGAAPSKDGRVMKILAYAASPAGKASVGQEDYSSRSPAQDAIWNQVEGLKYDAEISYLIDNLILNDMLNSHPESVILIFPDYRSIKSEADMQKALASLRADPAQLKARLHDSSPKEYEALFSQVKGRMESSGALQYRDAVNAVLKGAGLSAEY